MREQMLVDLIAIDRYMDYMLDDFLVEHHPEHEGRRVQIRLDCVERPHGEAADFIRAAQHAIRAHGLDFVVDVAPLAPTEAGEVRAEEPAPSRRTGRPQNL